MVIQNYQKNSLVDLLDNLVHEFNHAINSSINEIKITKTIPENLQKIKIKYQLFCNPESIDLEDYEKIIEKANNKIIIEMNTSNEFLAKQRILEFGPKCKILEPEDFKEKFVNLLKDMKAGYYCG